LVHPLSSLLHRPFLGVALCAGLCLVSSCGDDDPAKPEDDGILEVPGEFATLEAALAIAPNESTIRVGADSVDVDSVIVFAEGRDSITIQGRVGQSGTRPVLNFDVAGFAAIEVEPGATRIAIVGLTLQGTFNVGVILNGDGGRVEDCRIEDARVDGISTAAMADGVEIRENILARAARFAIHCVHGSSPLVVANTIVDTGDCGIYTASASAPTCERNLIARSANYGIACFSTGHVLDCNNITDSVTSDYSPICNPGANDFYEDPLFCKGTEFSLQSDSPCLGVMGCELVGAVGAGCGP